jgi:NAD(P)H-nitrite reductase large subunit
MATGTVATVPKMSGIDLPGVFALRNLEDAIKYQNLVAGKKKRNVL